jgi:hypothetical protein
MFGEIIMDRMLNKNITPTKDEIFKHIGSIGETMLIKFDEAFSKQYNMNRELKFPFGNNYGWGYKYSHKTKHLCYVFFEKDQIDVLLQLSSKDKEKLNQLIEEGLPFTKELWKNKYPCSDGGWINYRPKTKEDIAELMRLLAFKKKPASNAFGPICS